MKYTKRISLMGLVLAFCASSLYAESNGDEAAKKLMDGNQLFISGQPAAKDLGDTRIKELTKGQHPFAVVLSCSDSRVPRNIYLIRVWAISLSSGRRAIQSTRSASAALNTASNICTHRFL